MFRFKRVLAGALSAAMFVTVVPQVNLLADDKQMATVESEEDLSQSSEEIIESNQLLDDSDDNTTQEEESTEQPGEEEVTSVALGEESDCVYLDYGQSGIFTIDTTLEPYSEYTAITDVKYISDNESVLYIDDQGNFTAQSQGEANLYVNFEYAEDEYMQIEYTIYVYPDMTNATVSSDSIVGYVAVSDEYTYEQSIQLEGVDYVFSDSDPLTNLSYSYEGGANISVSDISVENNTITFTFSGYGTTTLSYVLAGKSFTLTAKVVRTTLNATSTLMYPGKTKTITVSNAKGKKITGNIKYESSNKSVATVNSNGKVTAKSVGNAIIKVSVGGVLYLGCAVSVTKISKVKAIKKATRIFESSTYSQPYRMKTGYYDCSSLVWRSFSTYGYKFGASSWAPTAAGIASYLNSHSKLIGKCTNNKIQKLKMQAGDLIFKPGAKNGRYRGIYHVEIFSGYDFLYFDDDGEAVVIDTWVTRYDGYLKYSIATETHRAIYGRP